MPPEPIDADHVAEALDTVKAVPCKHCNKPAVLTSIVPLVPQYALHYLCLSCGRHTLAILDMPKRVEIAHTLPIKGRVQRGN